MGDYQSDTGGRQLVRIIRANFVAAILGAIVLWMMPGAALAQCTGQSPAGALCGNPTGATAPPRFAQPSSFGLGGGVTSLGGLTGAITCGANLTCAGGSISATGGGGSGTVTSVATALPITGGAITSTGTIGCATCVTSAAALTANRLIIGGGLQATSALGSLGTTTTVLHGNAAGAPTFGAVALAADVSGTLPVANGGTGLTAGTSGGILAFTAAGTLASSGALTANNPVLGGGAGVAPSSGTRSGTTTVFATASGVLTSGNCVQIDANGNFVDAGGSCTTGGGGGTVAAGTAGQLAYYGSTGTTVSGNANITISSGAVTVGIAGSVLGSVKVAGNTSGTVTILPQAAAGTYNFNLPIAAGTSGAPLLSAGGGASPMTFGTVGVAFGGTGLTSGTSGGILGFTASGTIASSGALTASALVLGGGAGATPTALGSLGTTTTLLHGNAAGSPTFAAVVSADLNITTTTCTNQFVTAISAAAAGTCTTATLASAQFANQGTTATVLHGNAAGNPTFAAVNMASEVTGTLAVANGGTGAATLTNHGVLVGAGTSAITQLAAAAAGTVLAGQGASDPAFTATPTLGVAGTTLGSLALAGNTSGTVTISVNAAAGSYTFKLPNSAGTTGQLLSTDGSGNLSWTSTLAATIITSAANPCLAVGPNGNTNPMFRVVCNVTSAAAGVQITGNAAGAGVAIAAISSATDEAISISSKGVGSVTLSAGAGTIFASSQIRNSTALGYAGVDNITGMDLATVLTGKLVANSVEVMRWVQTQITAFSTLSAQSTFNSNVTRTIASAATPSWADVQVVSTTTTWSGSTNITGLIAKVQIDAPVLTASAAAISINAASTVYIAGNPTTDNSGGFTPTITNAWAQYIAGGRTYSAAQTIIQPAQTIASASGAVWSDLEISASTLTFTGTTTVNAIARVAIFSGTLAQTGAGTMTVTLAEGLYVEPPTAGTDVTITNAFAARFAGNIYLNAGSYINLTGASGSGGCGFRDNGGTMQVANCSAPGTWANFGTGGGSGTVTSIATTNPIKGGTITTTGTISCPSCNSAIHAVMGGA